MRVSARTDNAVRATVELAAAGADSSTPLKLEQIVVAQAIPRRFLQKIMDELREAGLVGARRGPSGGYYLTRPANEVSVADVIRATGGLLGGRHGREPKDLEYAGNAKALGELWLVLGAALDALETVTLADIAEGELPSLVRRLRAAVADSG